MTLTNIRARIRFLLGDISSSSYSDTNIDLAINDYYHKALGIAFMTCGEWEVSGETSTTNLVATQQEYVLPSNIISLYKVEANFTGNTGDWVNLPIANMTSLGSPLSNDTTNTSSTFCRVFDNSLFMQYPVGTSVTSGLKVHFIEDITELSAVGDEPDLPEFLITYLIHGACRDYTIRTSNDDDYKKFDSLLFRDGDNIEKYYSNRLPAIGKRITGMTETYK
jgi:hypothetical protein